MTQRTENLFSIIGNLAKNVPVAGALLVAIWMFLNSLDNTLKSLENNIVRAIDACTDAVRGQTSAIEELKKIINGHIGEK